MRGIKHDQEAVDLWGADTYDRIPKAVFAVVAWHLANAASGACDTPGAAVQRAAEEVSALAAVGALRPHQAKNAMRALSTAL